MKMDGFVTNAALMLEATRQREWNAAAMYRRRAERYCYASPAMDTDLLPLARKLIRAIGRAGYEWGQYDALRRYRERSRP